MGIMITFQNPVEKVIATDQPTLQFVDFTNDLNC